MGFYTLFSEPIKVEYKAKLFSESTLFYILCLIFNILIPILIIHKSDGLWRKLEFYREQPDINFKHQLILVLQLKDSENRGMRLWSTFPHLNKAFGFDQITVPFIYNKETDDNNDGKYDQLDINLKTPIGQNEQIVGIQLILFFDFKLNTKIELQMESLVNIEYNSPKVGSGLRVIADIKFNQKEPLVYRKRYIGLNDKSIESKEFFIEDVIRNSVRRNFSTSLDSNTYYNWCPKRDNSKQFELNANISYAEQLLYYRPGFWYLIKWALIQYLSIYLILYIIVKKIVSFVFENRLLNCIQTKPLINKFN